ncbi:PP2C family serine/threonine-protein phosphatase [Nocardioides eburneiflavus]|uniref:PP2C family serine/threonine-protein phosphatase n=1 Tax=Nocardioides eburneiflavus TaxID=2518372 RepID=UPI00143CD4F5|nr:PP2C family serine/threonine-protein phosphatase [Nocardioides eburneiflavus]
MSGAATTGTSAWRAVSASRRGSAHGEGVPNQDAVQVRRVAGAHGDVWVVAVADGHGGARYVRSDVGARTAVDVAVRQVAEALSDRDDPPAVLREVVPRIVEEWRTQVAADARDRPLTDDERARGSDGSATAYGATLLVAVVGGHGVAVAQVGDGDALVRSHGFATRPVPGDDRLVAGETTSMCLESAVDDFRYAVVPDSAEPDLVLLSTDGYGNSFAQADWWHGLVDDLADFVVRSGFDRVADELPGWLEESARVGGDDVSAVLLVRDSLSDDRVATPPRTRELSTVPDEALPATAAPPGRRRRAGLVAVIAAAAAVLGVVATLFLLGPGRSEAPPVEPAEPTTSVTSTTPDGTPTVEGTGRSDQGRKKDTRPDGPKDTQKKDGKGGDTGKDEPARPLSGQE